MKLKQILAALCCVTVVLQGCVQAAPSTGESDMGNAMDDRNELDIEAIECIDEDGILKIHELSKIKEGMTYYDVEELIGWSKYSAEGMGIWNAYKEDDGWAIRLWFSPLPEVLRAVEILDDNSNRLYYLISTGQSLLSKKNRN